MDSAVAAQMQQVDRDEIPDMPDRIIAATGLYHRVPVISRDGKIRSANLTTIWYFNFPRGAASFSISYDCQQFDRALVLIPKPADRRNFQNTIVVDMFSPESSSFTRRLKRAPPL